MDISERILKTISKIAKDENRRESSVTWNEIAIELAIELDSLFALRGVAVTLKDKQTPTFDEWKTDYFNTHFDGYINKFSKEFTTKEDVLKKYNSIFKISL